MSSKFINWTDQIDKIILKGYEQTKNKKNWLEKQASKLHITEKQLYNRITYLKKKLKQKVKFIQSNKYHSYTLKRDLSAGDVIRQIERVAQTYKRNNNKLHLQWAVLAKELLVIVKNNPDFDQILAESLENMINDQLEQERKAKIESEQKKINSKFKRKERAIPTKEEKANIENQIRMRDFALPTKTKVQLFKLSQKLLPLIDDEKYYYFIEEQAKRLCKENSFKGALTYLLDLIARITNTTRGKTSYKYYRAKRLVNQQFEIQQKEKDQITKLKDRVTELENENLNLQDHIIALQKANSNLESNLLHERKDLTLYHNQAILYKEFIESNKIIEFLFTHRNNPIFNFLFSSKKNK